MATVHVDRDAGELVVALSRAEKAAALHGEVRVPLASVREIDVVQDSLAAVRGLRAPGLGIPGRTKIGTWRRRGHRTFAVARRGRPALRLALVDAVYDKLVISHDEAYVLAERVRAAVAGPAPLAAAQRELPVSFAGAGAHLTGTLTLPAGEGAHAVALLLPGSGPIDRDGDHRSLPLGVGRDLAHALAHGGVASLRYDKRGVGTSEGVWLRAGLTDTIADAGAALTWLRARPEVRADAAFLVGHSEGALVATALAGDRDRREEDIAGVVLLGGAAKNGEETLAWQTRQIAGGLPAPVRTLLGLLRIDVVAKQRAAVARLRATTTDTARIQGRRVNARWHRELLALDPQPLLARVGAPVLAVTGGKDLQVDPADLDTIAATVPGPVQAILMPDLTHVLRSDPSVPTIRAYRRLARLPTDGRLLELVVDWVVGNAERHRAPDPTGGSPDAAGARPAPSRPA